MHVLLRAYRIFIWSIFIWGSVRVKVTFVPIFMEKMYLDLSPRTNPQHNTRGIFAALIVMSGYDTPNDALVATYDALERTTQLAAAPEFNRAVLQHSKSHPRMLESKTRPDSPLLRSITSGKMDLESRTTINQSTYARNCADKQVILRATFGHLEHWQSYWTSTCNPAK